VGFCWNLFSKAVQDVYPAHLNRDYRLCLRLQAS
jgi:hypothetical protein